MELEAAHLKNVFASLPRTKRGCPIVLGSDPKGKNFLYTNRNSVIIRDIANPAIADIYTGHSHPCMVAKYAPSGFYIASGDASGKVRIWDTVNREHLLKYEYHSLSGCIKDLAWSPDSKRIVVGGEGRETYANVFAWDTGTSVGKLFGHLKSVNSVDYRQDRPFRIATASEDFTLGFFEGVPFNLREFSKNHSNFVNCVRFDPKGTVMVSGGADGKMFVYDGKTGEYTGELTAPDPGNRAHKAGIYAISFSGDGKQLLSVSADKTAKIWDVDSMQLVTNYVMGKDLEDMQVGCLWQGDHLLTVSLSGYINYLDRNDTSKPIRVLKGHNNPITALTAKDDGSRFYTGSSDSAICEWNPATGDAQKVEGKGHKNQVQELCIGLEELVSVSVDDTLRYTQHSTLAYGDEATKLDSQPRAVSHQGDLTVVACVRELVVLHKKRQVSRFAVKYEPTSVDISKDGSMVAVGSDTGANQKAYHVQLYSLTNNSLTPIVDACGPKEPITRTGVVTAVKYSPDGRYLLVGDGDKRAGVYDVNNHYEQVGGDALSHTAKLNAVAWSPDSKHYCIGSLDTNMSVWSVEKGEVVLNIKGAHKLNSVSHVCWLDNTTVVTAGADCNLKIWSIA